jgi:alcohol dehydrogenase class IV
MVFDYLPRSVQQGSDMEAREKMANAATIAAIGMNNSHIALAHALGHSVGAVYSIPHGRITGLFLPYTIEYTANAGLGRYLELARIVGQCAESEQTAGPVLAQAIRGLMRKVGLPLSLQEAGISRETFDSQVELWCDRCGMDIALATGRRVPSPDEMRQLFEYAFDGRSIDF